MWLVYGTLFSSSEYQETSSSIPETEAFYEVHSTVNLDKLRLPEEQGSGQEGTCDAWNWFRIESYVIIGLKHNLVLLRHDKRKTKTKTKEQCHLCKSFLAFRICLSDSLNEIPSCESPKMMCSLSSRPTENTGSQSMWPPAIQNQCLWVKLFCPDWDSSFQLLWIQITVLGTTCSPGNDLLCIFSHYF